MYGEIKKTSVSNDAISQEALKLVKLISLDSKYDANKHGNVDFDLIQKDAYKVIDDVIQGILNPKLILPSKADILAALRKLDI